VAWEHEKNDQKSAPVGMVVSRLEKPVPLIGLHGQRLGEVTALRLSGTTMQVEQLELQTQWQTLQLRSETVRYDAGKEVFLLQRRRAPAQVFGAS
jgi:hypothetical protein